MADLRSRLQPALADRYGIEREVGRGGMATVFLAHDLKHDRQVALKVLHPELAASLGPERFLREIQVAARLNHPHIVPLHDSGQAGDLLYYVMPYVDGESLRQRLIRDKQLPVDDALDIARDVAAALDYAHRQGVVHRDIKPENVMLHEGEALVTDFGIAKAVTAAADENLTQTGSAVGTPAYMSPEQAAGEAELDGRSDVYSLGCMVYEMLAGSAPFTGPTAQAIITKRFTETACRRCGPRGQQCPRAVDTGGDRGAGEGAGRAICDRCPVRRRRSRLTGGLPRRAQPTTAVPHPAAAAKSIAVLPFADMSPQTGPGILLRRDGRGDHQRADQDPGAAGGLALLRLRVQGPESGHPQGRRATRREHRARGQRAEGRDQAPDHRPADQRGGRLPSLVGALRPRNGGRVRDPGRDRREHRARRCGWC